MQGNPPRNTWREQLLNTETMSNYKLYYFNGRGRAEMIRWIFVVGGQEYEDFRFESDEWPKFKEGTPFGQVPVLEVDGHKICQNYVIARFLAHRLGLGGKNEFDQAQADMLVACVGDLSEPMFAVKFEKDAARKADMQKKWDEDKLPNFLKRFDDLLKSNNGGDGYFVGDGVTYADLAVGVGFERMPDLNLDKHPKLKAWVDRVRGNERLAEWLKNRPETSF